MAEAQGLDHAASMPFDDRLDADGFNSSQRREEMEYADERAREEDQLEYWLDALGIEFVDMVKAVEEWKRRNSQIKGKSGRPRRPSDSVDRLRTSIGVLMAEGRSKTDACRWLVKNDDEWKGLSPDSLVNISGRSDPRKSARE